MRVGISVFAIVVATVAACGGGDPNACPAGTTPVTWDRYGIRGRGKESHCETSDGVWDGPVREIDEKGREHLIGHIANGKREGFWRMWLSGGQDISEVHYRAGLADGSWRIFSEGMLIMESHHKAGLFDGVTTTWDVGGLRSIRYYTNGHRAGVWQRFRAGAVTETRVYSAPDVLGSIDGRLLAKPVERIDLLDGKVVARTDCTRAAEPEERCLDLFEGYQRCTLERDHAECERRAQDAYQHPNYEL